MANEVDPEVIALGSFIKFDADGSPFLQGFKCSHCSEILLETRRGCPKCAALSSLLPHRLSTRGKLTSFTIVHRSFPGVRTPFVSAIVELEGGVFLKGNLLGVEPVAEAINFNMQVAVQFDHPSVATRPDANVVRYVFVPAAQ